jgi:hypothetical protein
MLFRKPKPIRAESLATIQAAASSDGPATFSAIALDGKSTLPVGGYEYPVVIDLSGLTTSRKMMVNLDHQKSQRVGHIVKASNDGKTLSLEGVFSAATPYRDEVIESHRSGMPWDVSVEVAPKKLELVKAGKSAVVNGNVFEGPVYVARKSELFGLAFVSQGAFESNQVSIAAMMDEPEMETTEADDEAFAKFASDHGFDVMTMSEEERAALEVLFMSQSSSDEPVTASLFNPQVIRAEATKTYDLIEAKVLEYEDTIKDQQVVESIQATAFDKMQSLKRIAAAERYTSDRFQKESTKILAELSLELIRAERPKGPGIISSSRDTIMDSKLIEAHFIRKIAGENAAIRFFGERVVEAERASGLTSTHDVCKAINHQNGNVTHDGIQATIINAMRPILASGPTNISLPNILNNVANKVLLLGYEEYPSAIFDIAEVKSVKDFKDNPDIRMSAGENLAVLAPGGEIKHGTLSEENVFNRKVDTYAQMRMIDRRDLVNDDLRAFDQLQKIDGAAAKRTLINLFWQVWMTGAGSFWHANNANLLTTGTALSIANLGKGISAMRKQTDSKGNVLDMMPTYLVVPPELESTAKPIVNSAQIIGAGSVSPDGNPMYQIVRAVITEPRLSNAGYTNNSLTAWYLSAQKQAGAIVISFLEGKDSPTVETELADFNKLGLQMRVYHDFGVSLGDPKAAFKATGAS